MGLCTINFSLCNKPDVIIEHNNNIPIDYDGQLNDYDIKKSEPGKIILHSPKDLKLGEIYFEGSTSIKSYYKVPAINLVKNCEAYEPDYILLYLPNEKKYASWDTDHWVITIFNKATWNDIKKNPTIYLNAQWNISTSENMKRLTKLEKYDLIKGWPIQSKSNYDK